MQQPNGEALVCLLNLPTEILEVIVDYAVEEGKPMARRD